ncbi:hypothetical protein QFC24_003739 [Naganishia onofrii]|uniref:Uncharacterized protein n=1 Tax=Naganishia onofrii TaxID=1851511 RepID=A0ACC2XJH7_9TREE|nr:hypothetical protein QFC24_003739 [Naganishia onofrii]
MPDLRLARDDDIVDSETSEEEGVPATNASGSAINGGSTSCGTAQGKKTTVPKELKKGSLLSNEDKDLYHELMKEVSDLRLLMLVAQIVELSLRVAISEIQLDILRAMIKELQDTSYRERPTIVRCVNLHFLSHLPDDIARYGPVYSWWLFNYERMNKFLKSVNSNGHSIDTPRLAYNKFLRMAGVTQLSNYDTTGSDEPAKLLAQQSEAAFQRAFASVNLIEEERDANPCQEQFTQSHRNSHRSRSSVLAVKRKKLQYLSNDDLIDVLRVLNQGQPRGTMVVAEHSSTANQQSTESPTVAMSQAAQYYTEFTIGRKTFRTPPPYSVVQTRLDDTDFVKYRGCFFEWRTDEQILRAQVGRAPVGMFDSVFEVTITDSQFQVRRRRFMKVLMLKPYEECDPYRFQDRV